MVARGGSRGRRPLGGLVATIVLGIVAIACTSAATPDASSATQRPSVSASLPSTSSTPTIPAATIKPIDIAPPSLAISTPEPTRPLSELPSLGPAPSGDWTGLHWTKASEPPIIDPVGSGYPDDFAIFGWSKGYLAFRSGTIDIGKWAVAVAHSTDGVRWTAGGQLDMTGLPAVGVNSVVEGPAGVLAMAIEVSACGGPSLVSAMWQSADGMVWRQVDIGTAFGGGFVSAIDAGSAGYIATGSTGGDTPAPAVWTSADGLTWKTVDLNAATFAGIQVQNAAAFAGGYVLAGSVLSPNGDGCGSEPYVTPSLWWSADGRKWSRGKVPNTRAGTTASMKVWRIDDHALLATEWSSTATTSTQASWTSTDGQTWKPFPAAQYVPMTNGQRGLIVDAPTQVGDGAIDVSAFASDLSVHKLAETGDVPDEKLWTDYTLEPSIAFGPTGLIVANAAGDFWVGVPVAG